MKKKVLIMILLTIMFLPILKVGATCYRKCDYNKVSSGDCSYTSTCNTVSCTLVDRDNCSDSTKDCYNKCQYYNGTHTCSFVNSCARISCNSVSGSYCQDSDNKVSCGDITGIPEKIPDLTSFLITLIQIVVPIVLVIIGSIDLFKGITAGKEDEMKKGQQMFVKRLVVAVLIFFVVVIVKFLISVVADSTDNIVECIDCFLSGTDNCRR